MKAKDLILGSVVLTLLVAGAVSALCVFIAIWQFGPSVLGNTIMTCIWTAVVAFIIGKMTDAILGD